MLMLLPLLLHAYPVHTDLFRDGKCQGTKIRSSNHASLSLEGADHLMQETCSLPITSLNSPQRWFLAAES